MNIFLKLTAVVFTASLAACQHTAPYQAPPQPVDPVPPSVGSQQAPRMQPQQAQQPVQQQRPQQTRQQQRPQSQAQQQAQGQSAPVITLHLAQARQEPSLVEVDAGGPAPLYALPQPVLTQADIGRVSPVNTPNGTFLLLEMNARGIPKLDNITQQARGHYLLLSVQGQLASVAQIGEIIKDGRLLVPTQGPEHTQAIIRLMQGRQ